MAIKIECMVKLAETIEPVFANADYISLNIPLVPETKGFINKDKFKLMKPGVRILNFARGGLVNNADLADAIASGKVACYVTDFPDEEALKMEKVISIPHLGASTNESETNCAIMAVNQMQDYLDNGNIVNSVNFPAAEMERGIGCRIVIACKNQPDAVSLGTSVLATEGINIDGLLTRKLGDLTYIIMDIDRKNLDDSFKNKFRAINGVFLVRIIPAT